MLPIIPLLAAQLAFAAAVPVPAVSDTTRLVTQYKLERWTDRDGLPQNSIFSIAQTADRFLWLAAEEGLIRFDGQQFIIFNRSNTPVLERSQVLALAAAPDGDLWIGTARAGLLNYRRGEFTAYRAAPDALPSDRVQVLAVASDGVVWAATNAGLVRRGKDGEFTVFREADGLPSDDITTLALQADGSVWAGSRHGLARITDGVRRFSEADGLPAVAIRALAAAADGGMWVATNGGGVAHFDGTRFRVLDARLGGELVQSIAEDANGSIWLGTSGGGLVRWRDGRIERLDNHRGAADLVWSLLHGADGSLWVGTNGRGLLHLRETPFVPLGEAEGLSGDIALAVLQSRDGMRWIGTAGSGLNRVDPHGVITRFGQREGLRAARILSLAELPDGELLIGSLNGSLTSFRNGRFSEIGARFGLAHSVMAILPDPDGGYWLGTTGGVVRVRGDSASRVTAADDLPDEFVMALHRSDDGALWVGTRQGLARIVNGTAVPFDGQSRFAGVPVGAFLPRADGSVWVATQGHGIARIDSGGTRFLGSDDGLCDDLVHALVEDGRGSVWLSSNRGILRIDAAAADAFFDGTAAHVACTLFGTADGMRSREANGGFMPAGISLADGRIMFPTMQGVVTIDPQRSAAVSPPPAAALKFAVLGTDTVQLGARSRLEVRSAHRNLELHFTSPYFEAPEQLRFRFRLEGFDQQWQSAGARRAAYYTNLPPGEYTFHVAAANGDGEWQPSQAALRVTVPARFHETRWFVTSSVVALLLLVIVLHRLRLAAVRRRAEQLGALVEERTRAEERYRELFENASRMQEQLQQAAKMEAVGRLAGGVAHDFNNLLTVITSYSAMLESDLPADSALREDVDQIRRAADSAAGLTRQLLAFSRRQVMQPRVLDVNAQIETVVSMLRRIIGVNISLATELQPGIWPVHVDAGQLEQVLMNLALNARDAMPDGGRLRFRTENTELRHWQSSRLELAPGRYVRLSVEDNGTGIEPDAIPHVFEPFFTTKESGRGTGLGLATVYGVVKQSGGQIEVESEPGHGTRFHIYLPTAPRADVAVKEGTGEAADGSALPGRANILLVDDEVAVSVLARKILQRRGFHVRTASSGDEALRILEREGPFDLLLTDLMMPEMDGRELGQRVLAARPGTSILYMSGYTEDEVIRRGVLPGGEHFIGKPFTPAGLADAVHAALGAAGPAPAVAGHSEPA